MYKYELLSTLTVGSLIGRVHAVKFYLQVYGSFWSLLVLFYQQFDHCITSIFIFCLSRVYCCCDSKFCLEQTLSYFVKLQ